KSKKCLSATCQSCLTVNLPRNLPSEHIGRVPAPQGYSSYERSPFCRTWRSPVGVLEHRPEQDFVRCKLQLCERTVAQHQGAAILWICTFLVTPPTSY